MTLEVPPISCTVGATLGVNQLEEASWCPEWLSKTAKFIDALVRPLFVAIDLIINAAFIIPFTFVGEKLGLTSGPEKHIELLHGLPQYLRNQWCQDVAESWRELTAKPVPPAAA